MPLNINNIALKNCNVSGAVCNKIAVNGITVWLREYDILSEMAGSWKYLDSRYYAYPCNSDSITSSYKPSITSQTSSKLTLTCKAMKGQGSGCINAYVGPIDFTNYSSLTLKCSSITATTSGSEDEGVVAKFCLRNSLPTSTQLATEKQTVEGGGSLTYGSFANDNAAFLKGVTGTVKTITGNGTFTLDCSGITGEKYLLVQLASEYNGGISEPTATMSITSIKLSN